MDAEMYDLIMTIAAGLVTLVLMFVRKKQTEAYAWGDEMLKKALKDLEIVKAIAVLFPVIKPIVDKMEKLTQELYQGWNDPAVGKDRLQAIMQAEQELFDEAMKLIEAAKKLKK